VARHPPAAGLPSPGEKGETALFIERAIRGAAAMEKHFSGDGFDAASVRRSTARSVLDQIANVMPEHAARLSLETIAAAVGAVQNIRGRKAPRSSVGSKLRDTAVPPPGAHRGPEWLSRCCAPRRLA
jgi:hypothetical protein